MQDKVGLVVDWSHHAYVYIRRSALVKTNSWQLSTIILLSREREKIFLELSMSESEQISNITGCLEPCHYKKYILLAEQVIKSKRFKFSLWALSTNTRVETEELIYPVSTLVAEFGGTLGLFLGFSFISLWDNFDTLKRVVALLRENSLEWYREDNLCF